MLENADIEVLMDKVLDLFDKLYMEIIHWVNTQLFTVNGLYHVIGVVIVMLISWGISSRVKRYVNSFIKKEMIIA